jgi:D-amino-acid oxidase
MKTHDVCVLGGGVSGITTAIVLQSLGFNPVIYTRERPLQNGEQRPNPAVPTGYAMATAYPHNLRVANLERISDDTQKVFSALLQEKASGVQIQQLFEVFETEPDPAPLADRRMNFQTFEGKPKTVATTVRAPVREGAEHIWGWSFDTYFADMPLYIPFLWSLFSDLGGTVQSVAITPENLFGLSAGRPIVNCLGLGAVETFKDKADATIVRGRQVIVHGAPIARNSDGKPLGYNYTPVPHVFSRVDGSAEYVHFFGRSDGWILGQTREPGKVNDNGDWIGLCVKADEIDVTGQAVPRQILELNSTLLRSWLGISIDDYRLEGREGLRYYRDPANTGVRLESETRDGALIVHNYGHGGSGVTMSWGCAIKCAQLLIGGTGLPKHENTMQHEFMRIIAVEMIPQL